MLAFIGCTALGAVGEELGWRGFLQPVLANRHGPLRAALIVGALWSVWHINQLADPIRYLSFLMFCLAISVGMAILCVGSWWQRALVAGLVHFMVNVSMTLGTNPERVLGGGFAQMLPMILPPVLLCAVLLWCQLAHRSHAAWQA